VTVLITPSVLNSDLGRLRENVTAAAEGGAEWIHVDVMDGHFVPNLSFGGPIIRALRKMTDLPLDVHLMVEHPERYIDEYADSGAAIFTLHTEATAHVQRHLAHVRERGMKAGLAFNPGTPLAVLEEVWRDVDMVLIMTVNPGFGGQKYLRTSAEKIRRARTMLTERGHAATIEVDGGITVDTIADAHTAGADAFVAGTAVFGQPDPAEAVRALKRACLARA
jgi:ribulose-phosphate 3-epimerase